MKGTTSTGMLPLFLAALMFVGMAVAVSGRQAPPAGDNTKANRGDANKGSTTADQQKESPADREITRNIRTIIMKDKSLSTYAHNVKVITQDGKVTLKGPVRSDDEKTNVEGKAAAVAGAGNVDSQLTVVPPKE